MAQFDGLFVSGCDPSGCGGPGFCPLFCGGGDGGRPNCCFVGWIDRTFMMTKDKNQYYIYE